MSIYFVKNLTSQLTGQKSLYLIPYAYLSTIIDVSVHMSDNYALTAEIG